MKFHPLANLSPLISKDERSLLAADIKQRVLDQPVVTHEGKILDGRNRWLACREAGVEPRYVEYEGNDPLGFVIAANTHRRHLRPGQKALVAGRLVMTGAMVNLPPGVTSRDAAGDAASGALDADELARLQAMADEFWADDERR